MPWVISSSTRSGSSSEPHHHILFSRDLSYRPREALACGGYSYLGRVSYFHCLGTLKDYRQRGIAKHMAKVSTAETKCAG
jgi:hypothetical protein